jgi:hypothetical protein
LNITEDLILLSGAEREIKKSANDLVKDFVKIDILEETTGQSRNRFFRIKPYLEIFRG